MSRFTNLKSTQVNSALSNRLKRQQEEFKAKEQDFNIELNGVVEYANTLLKSRDVEIEQIKQEHKKKFEKSGRPKKNYTPEQKKRAAYEAQRKHRIKRQMDKNISNNPDKKKLLEQIKLHINELSVDNINLKGLMDYLNNLNNLNLKLE